VGIRSAQAFCIIIIIFTINVIIFLLFPVTVLVQRLLWWLRGRPAHPLGWLPALIITLVHRTPDASTLALLVIKPVLGLGIKRMQGVMGWWYCSFILSAFRR
jgi:uncharacterized SAM-binding protein YcdF (DUF218 family)